MSSVLQTWRDHYGPLKSPPRPERPKPRGPGRPQTGDSVKLVQALADGHRIAEASVIAGVASEKAAAMLLRKLQKACKVTTNFQLVAHYVRNGWID
jgi:hypothetical protein